MIHPTRDGESLRISLEPTQIFLDEMTQIIPNETNVRKILRLLHVRKAASMQDFLYVTRSFEFAFAGRADLEEARRRFRIFINAIEATIQETRQTYAARRRG